VIGISGKESLTAVTVGKVRNAWQRNPALYDGIFQQIDQLTLQGVEAMQQYDLERLGDLMNICHGLLNALRVSSWEVEELVQIAREHGALGAKLTGGGGGGSIVALCPQNRKRSPLRCAMPAIRRWRSTLDNQEREHQEWRDSAKWFPSTTSRWSWSITTTVKSAFSTRLCACRARVPCIAPSRCSCSMRRASC
jgi:mevalonate kinase